MSVIHITADSYEEEVVKSDKPVLIDFWAPWCGPCQMMGPVFEDLSKEIPDIKFVKVNTDEEPAIASQFKIQGIPALLFVKDGKEIKRIVGFRPKEELMQNIEEIVDDSEK